MSQTNTLIKRASNWRNGEGAKITTAITHGLVLVLSLLLIVYISYDTFKNIPFLENHHYMTFQFWVCVVFLADFFIELILAVDRKVYLKARWFFFLISIPYLNIVHLCDIELGKQVLFFIRFIPLIRGAYSLAMVLGVLSNNKAESLMSQYVTILLALIYILSLIFYYEEHAVNTNVHTFWDALYWAAMNVTTVGCYFSAVTPVGKVISVVLPTAGMLMLPLFTVFVTSKVKELDERNSLINSLFRKNPNADSKDVENAIKAQKKANDNGPLNV